MITFTEEELKGVPKDVISGYTKRAQDGNEVYDVTYKTPDIFPIVIRLIVLYASLSHGLTSLNLPKTQKHVDVPWKVMKAVSRSTSLF